MAFSLKIFLPLLTFVLTARHVYADVSLIFPGFDEQPLSVKDLGEADGRTTWQVVAGKPTGTFEQADFPATATLVEGPNDAVLLYGVDELSVTVSYSCAFQAGGVEVCNAFVANPTETDSGTITDTVTPFLVQGGPTTPPSSNTPKSSGTPSSSGSGSGSPSGSGSGSGNSSGAIRMGSGLAAGAIAGFMALVLRLS